MPAKNLKSKIEASTLNSGNSLRRLRMPRKFLVRAFLTLLLVGAVSTAGYYYYMYNQVENAAEIADVKKTIDAVKKLMSLPDEVPTVATVTDKSKLQDQPFFKGAENGDKVLIYKSIKKAILYRPSTNKIIDIAPVNTDVADGSQNNNVLGANNGNKVSGTPTPTVNENQVFNVAVLNSSDDDSAVDDASADIQELNNVEIVHTEDASKSGLKPMVVILNKSASNKGREIAEKLGYELSEKLPEGETLPSGTDIAVIIGSEEDVTPTPTPTTTP